jgi:cyclopropane-fatty-acyl-phospholipid synthase
MSLIGKFIDQILPVGSITIVGYDGKRDTYGAAGGRHVTVRLHDRRAAMDIFRNPRLRVGELYMDGRLTIEDGTILDLLELVVGAKPWEQGRRKALGKGKAKWLGRFFRRNDVRKSRKNVAMTTCSTAAPISPTPRTASSKHRPTRRRISPPSST